MVGHKDFSALSWRKSRRSDLKNSTAGCVSLAPFATYCAIRDSKRQNEGVLVVSRLALCRFLQEVKEGRYDLLANEPTGPS